MKIVSFKVAKVIKEAGYPQNVREGDLYFAENGLTWDYNSETYELYDDIIYCVCPTYLEVWLWLWREKGIRLNTDTSIKDTICIYWDNTIIHEIKNMRITDPEEAIVAAIEYLVNNKLLK